MKSIDNIATATGGGGGSIGTFVNYTLNASNWTLNTTTGFFEYSFESTYPSSRYDVMVGSIDNMDAIMYNQARGATMVGDKNTNKLVCMGKKPTANIPVMLYVLDRNDGDTGSFETYTLLASGWTFNSTTELYEYSFESSYPSSRYDIMMSTIDTMDATAFNQARAAVMVGDENTNKYICLGDKPTVDIPVLLYILNRG